MAWIPLVSAAEDSQEESRIDWDKAREFWAYLAPQKPEVPASNGAAENESWPINDIDRFILRKLEKASLRPSAPADRGTLHRRLSYDLTGLPPTPEELDRFDTDQSPDAYERLVDRLLDSSHFGEKLASMWLNVARYAEDQAHQVGNDTKSFYSNAWRYRSWVIESFNNDLPYNEFVRMQLAADEYGDDGKQHLAALGFLGLGPQYYNRNRLDVLADEWEDRVDTVTRGFLGTTVACARCHEHKYDPISMRDYYALAGIFASVENHAADIGGSKMHIVKDIAPKDLNIFKRGNVDDKGPVVPRAFLRVLSPPGDAGAFQFDYRSGRRALAEAITDRGNPLTARVLVNRIWGEIFGEPIVRTPSNFGQLGERPTHPQLLDYLAVRFMDDGWSIKRLVRSMVLSATYRQSSTAPSGSKSLEIDPANRLLSRMNRRRLTAEMLRDSMLMVAGKLKTGRGGRSLELADSKNHWRTVYSRISRLDLDPFLRLHDYPDPNVHAAKRDHTTTPGQKLFLLNSPFVLGISEAISAKAANITDKDERLDTLYRRVLARPPSPTEKALAMDFFAPEDNDVRQAKFAHVLLCSNAFLYRD